MNEALAPVRDALLAAARAEAARVVADAEAVAAGRLAEGRTTAERIRREARAQGEASGRAAAGAERNRARRTARAGVLRARRKAYERLRRTAREAVARLPAEPGWPRLRAGMATAVSRALGPDAAVREYDGGVAGQADGRRVDLSLATLADQATDEVARGLEES
jgi:vacuolar-type H+-ATPase subunit E/Vma4